ncbi:MAG: hypothetical protein WBX27_19440 [Specibacter sp.]
MAQRSIHSLEAAAATAFAGVLALLVLASCSVQPSGPSSAPAAQTAQAATTVSTVQGAQAPSTVQGVQVPGPAEPGAAGGNAAGLPAWVPPGPADPVDPPPDGWYSPLVQKDCQSMPGADTSGDAGAATLVTAAYQLCVAVTTDNADAWDAASADLKSLPIPASSGCLETATYAVLSEVVAYHVAHAGAPVETVPGTGTACPLGLTGIIEQGGDPTAVSPVVPAEGGTQLRLMGRFLAVDSVLVAGQSVPVSQVAENDFDFVAPPATAAGSVTVTAVGPDGATLPGSATFSYAAPESQPPASSDTPAESTPPLPSDAPAESTTSDTLGVP